MKDQPRSSIWLTLALLSVLFALSVLAPRQWRRIARPSPQPRRSRTTAAPARPTKPQPALAAVDRTDRLPATGAVRLTVEPGFDRSSPAEDSDSGLSSAAGPHLPALPDESADKVASIPPLAGFVGDLYAEPNLPPSEPIATSDTSEASEPPAELGVQSAVPLEDQSSEFSAEPSETIRDCGRSAEAAADEAASDEAASDEAHRPLEAAALIAQLQRVAWDRQSGEWAAGVKQLLAEWAALQTHDDRRTARLLDRLRQRLAESDQLLETARNRPQAGLLRRVQYGLSKRLSLWSKTHDVLSDLERREQEYAVEPSHRRLAESVRKIRQRLAGSPQAEGWRRYLFLDELSEMAEGDSASESPGARRGLAAEVLKRLAQARQRPSESRFVREPPMVELEGELQNWAAEPVDVQTLLAAVERYEQNVRPTDAHEVAQDARRLALSELPEARQLAREIEVHYRNCNVRLSLNRELIQRLLPAQPPSAEPVRETVLGIPVRGRSYTTTELTIRLIPDPHRARLALVARGNTVSRTNAYSQTATISTRGQTYFEIEKPIEFGLHGLTVEPARASADASAELRDVETDFDAIPIVGWLVRNEVERQYAQRQPQTRHATERLVAIRAADRLDDRSKQPVVELNHRIEQRVLLPLKNLGLDQPLTDFQTSDQRLTLRVRLAGRDQLGAHTPRPQSPDNSSLSVQLHESAINNCIERLNLAGRTFTAPELQRAIAEKLNLVPEHATDRDDLLLAFSSSDPARVRCDAGRLLVTLHLDWLQKGRRRWRDFEVRVAYRPDLDAPGGQLVRDGIVQLIGQRLGVRGQIALRSVFSNLFRENRTFQLLPERLAADPLMADLTVTQFVIEDGWLGLALGPKAHRRFSTARAQ